MHTSNRLLAGIGVAALAAATLVGCSTPAPAPTEDPAGGATLEEQIATPIDPSKVKKTLKIGVDNPHYLFHEDFLVAEREGFLKEVGIDSIEIITSDDPLPGLIGGSLDFIVFDTDTVVAAAAKGTDLEFLSVWLGGEANILGVGPGIETVEDLKGKTITGGQFNVRNDWLTRQLLIGAGIDPEVDVKMVETGGQSNSRLEAIISGQVDAASVQLRHRVPLEEAGGKFLLQELTTAPQNGISTTGKLLAEYPDTAAALLTAVLKARAYIQTFEHDDELLDWFEELGFDAPPAYREVWRDENAVDYHTSDGGFEVSDMNEFIEQQQEFGDITPGTDWRDHVDLIPLWRAQTELGLPLRPAPADVE